MSGTEDALLALSQDLVREIAVGMAMELAAPPPQFAKQQSFPQPGGAAPPSQPHLAAQVNPWPPKVGAAAVHPHLGGHLLTQYPGDTISGHAHAHVPRPIQPMLPDPREQKLADQGQELSEYQEWEGQVRDYQVAAGELEKFAHKHVRSGKRLPPYKRTGKSTAKRASKPRKA